MKLRYEIPALSLLSALLLAGCGNFSLDALNNITDDPTKAAIAGPQVILANAPTNYSFTSESDGDYPLTYTVTWGDGAASAVPNVKSGVAVTGSHAWTTNGHYLITATVTDGHGKSSKATYDIDVGTPVAKLAHPDAAPLGNANVTPPAEAERSHSMMAPIMSR